ncbi:endonuclease/exonuclease/phosphatase family protein [Nocardioides solisilvae]|uniref:endonuclease/exonuclease/phosphatase family protein n=1 Tax=Nocardioides solisilvae TaxID=1542435 RepID=UPI000D746B08|nr:endonuclease/exonuclease/phosphatase family protein [Nocardioides solisilvae]
MIPAPPASPPRRRARGLSAAVGVVALTAGVLGASAGLVATGAGAATGSPLAAASLPTSTAPTSPVPSPTDTVSPTPSVDPTPTGTPVPTESPSPTVPPVPTPEPTLPPSVTGSDVTIVQANLQSPQSVVGFQGDVVTVRAQAPDVITYNEVAFRQDVNLAPPPGYAMFRTPGQYTGATPVAWRTDRWTALQAGTHTLSDHRGIPRGKQTELGRRAANWVTLQSPEGRVISVVSAHLAPLTKGMPDVRRPGVQALSVLVDQLDDHGPVLVGGDFNMHHLGSDYAGDLFTQAGLVPTYDLLGTRFPTYDGKGAIIDYVFLKGTDQLRADVHYPVELNSDHKAVVAGFSWTVDAASLVTTVQNDLTGYASQRRAVLRALQQPLADAERGDKVQLATTRLALPAFYRELVKAGERGVKVQLTTRSGKLTAHERKIKKALAGKKGSWVRRCGKACSKKWAREARPTTLMLVRDGNKPALRLDVNRQVRKSIITRETRLTESRGPLNLKQAGEIFRTLR